MKSEFGKRQAPSRKSNYRLVAGIGLVMLVCSSIFHFNPLRVNCLRPSTGTDIAAVQECAIRNHRSVLSYLDNANPVEADEFLERRDRLAQALAENDVDAYVLEPGYTFQ